MKEFYKKLFERSPIIQIVTDDANQIKAVNSKFCNYFGFDHREIEGRHVSSLLAIPPEVDAIEEQTNNYPNVWEVLTKDGNHRFIAIETTNVGKFNLITAYDLTKEAFRARNNSINVKELKKYLIGTQAYE